VPDKRLNRAFLQLVPQGWFRRYLETMVEFDNETPLPFHFLSVATVMGNILGLGTWATLAKGVRVYPNVNAMLLSPAGKCRRGEGTKLAARVARRAGVNVFAGKVTPEGLADEMRQNGSVLLYVEELAMLLGKREHQRAVVPFLTKALLHGEGQLEERTRGAGARITVPMVNLSMIATTAPEWFMTSMPEEAHGGGLMSRYLVCCLDDREVYHVDIDAEGDDDEVMTKLAGELRHVTEPPSMVGQVHSTKGAQAWFKDWYMRNEVRLMTDDRLEPHRNRAPANLLRVAVLLGVAQGREQLDEEILHAALKMLEWLEPTVWRLYATTDTLGGYVSKAEQRIISRLSGEAGMAMLHPQLARLASKWFPDGVRGVKMCLEGMEEKGMVERVMREGTGRVVGWPPYGWRLVVEKGKGE